MSTSEWPLWEVFTQKRAGLPFEHAGSVHAPDKELALQMHVMSIREEVKQLVCGLYLQKILSVLLLKMSDHFLNQVMIRSTVTRISTKLRVPVSNKNQNQFPPLCLN